MLWGECRGGPLDGRFVVYPEGCLRFFLTAGPGRAHLYELSQGAWEHRGTVEVADAPIGPLLMSAGDASAPIILDDS